MKYGVYFLSTPLSWFDMTLDGQRGCNVGLLCAPSNLQFHMEKQSIGNDDQKLKRSNSKT